MEHGYNITGLALGVALAATATLTQASGWKGATGLTGHSNPSFQSDRVSQHFNRHRPEYEGVSTLKLDKDIKHYRWLLKVGEGPYDYIRIHRYVREPHNRDAKPGKRAPDRRKVLFVINGTWGQEAPESIAEYDSLYFPGNGYDLWTIDFRTSFIPNVAYDEFAEKGEAEGLSSTAGWTYGVFREDIKLAVDFARKTAGVRKLFMGGRSRGGRQLFMYAAKYSDDLKGMIALDGGPIYRAEEDASKQQPEFAYQAAMQALQSGSAEQPLLGEVGNYQNVQLGGALPNVRAQVGAPLPDESALPFGPVPDGSPIESLTDLTAYNAYWAWGEGKVTNVYTVYPGGEGETYMDRDNLAFGLSSYTRYWPNVQNVEETFMAGYEDNPYLDYDDTQGVTLPVIHFSGEFTCPAGACVGLDRPYSTSSPDFTVKYLPGFGHLDVYYGTHSEEEVKKPMLDWMNARL